MDSTDTDGRFWLTLLGIAVAIGLGTAVLLLLIGAAWYAWGFIGTLVVIGAVAMIVGWLQDRRHPGSRSTELGR
jgi:Kef-type K+ transport system membrane component KefB